MSLKRRIKENYWLRSGSTTLLQQSIGVMAGFLSFYFLVRIISKTDFGIWILFLSTVSLFEIIRSELIRGALIRFLSVAPEEERGKITSTAICLNMGVTSVLTIILVGIAPLLASLWQAPSLKEMLYIYIVTFYILGFQLHFNSIEQAYLNFSSLFYSMFIMQTLFSVLLGICYTMGWMPTLLQLVQAQALFAFLATVPAYLYARRRLSRAFKFSRTWLKKIIDYGKYSMGTSLHATFSNVFDGMLIGLMLSPKTVSIFNTATRISQIAHLPTNAMASIVFPLGARRSETQGNAALKFLYEKSVGSILALLVPTVVFLSIFATPIVNFIAGPQYGDAIPLLRVALLYCIFIPYSRQTGTILEASGKTKLNFFLVLCTGLFNIVLNYFLIQEWGAMGAVCGALAAWILFFIVSQYILNKLFKINIWSPWQYAFRFYPETWRMLFTQIRNS